jgi:hypothetical protein
MSGRDFGEEEDVVKEDVVKENDAKEDVASETGRHLTCPATPMKRL